MIPAHRDSGETHTGAVRPRNEDNFTRRPGLGLWAVADGAGGHQSGAFASATIIAALNRLPIIRKAPRLLAETRLAVATAHKTLCTEAASRGPGAMIVSTIVILMLRNGYFACLWAGDSRAYLRRNGELTQITHDHSLVQELVDEGRISPQEAERHPQAHIITRAVGAGWGAFKLDKVTGTTQPGDQFLLCSDGLTKALSNSEIAGLLAAPESETPSERLIAAALARLAKDNVTAVTVELLPG